MQNNFFFNLAQLKKAFARSMEEVCAKWDLTQNELSVLFFLAAYPGKDRASDIVLYRGLAKSHVSLSISQLEKAGLLIKQPDPTDRRSVHLKLTESGAAIAEEAKAVMAQLEAVLFRDVTPEEMEGFQAFAQKVIRNIAQMGL